MEKFSGIRRLFRLDRVDDVTTDVDDELRFHFESTVRDLVAGGMTAEAARREADRRFGDVRAARERLASIDTDRVSSERRAEWLEGFSEDLRYAARSLQRTPIFTLTALCTLGLGLGAVTAMFAIVYGVLLAPLPYGNLERLVAVRQAAQASSLSQIGQTPGTYFTYSRLARTAESIGLYSEGSANVTGTDESQPPERVSGSWMTASIFPTL